MAGASSANGWVRVDAAWRFVWAAVRAGRACARGVADRFRAGAGLAGLQIQTPVHLAAVPDHRNGDHTGGVVHVVDDPVVTYPYPQPWPVAL